MNHFGGLLKTPAGFTAVCFVCGSESPTPCGTPQGAIATLESLCAQWNEQHDGH